MRKSIIYILLLLFISACERPGGVLSKSEMEQVLFDYHIAQAMVGQLPAEERYKAEMYMNAVYEKHDITKADFDTSIVWYNRHAEDLEDIYDNLHYRFTVMNEELQLKSGRNDMITIFSANGDTVNIWNGTQLILLRNKDILNKESFRIKADTSFYRGDKFQLKTTAKLINSDRSSRNFRLVQCLAVRYKDGKVISTVQSITRSDSRQLSLTTDEFKDVDEIFGYFYYNGMKEERNFAIIQDIQLVKMHNQRLKARRNVTISDSITKAVIDTGTAETIGKQ